MADLRQDLTFTLRRLSKSPGFVAASVLSIALGIGANSTIFSMVSRFVLRPTPVGSPSTLIALSDTTHGECCNHLSWPLFRDLQDQMKSFSGVAAYAELIPASIGGSGDPERIWGQSTTTNFFDVTQLPMALGRGFLAGEDRTAVVVLGYGIWQRRFAADPSLVGKTVSLSGRPYTVVGVASQGFHGLDQILFTQFWVPLGGADQLLPNTTNFQSRNFNWLAVAARIRPGVSRASVAAELDVLAHRAAAAYPQFEKDRGFQFDTAGSLPPRDRPFILMFLAALTVVALLVLFIACANLANLLLAQAAGRQKEMSVRLALGASRVDLMRQMLTESLLLAIGGGILGVVLSLWATSALSALHLPAPVPLDLSLTVDWRTLLYTFLLSVATGFLFGLAPGWAAARPLLIASRPGSGWTLRNILVVSQMATSLVLLCATGLFLRSLESAAAIDTGFRSQGVVMMAVDPRLHGYTPERTAQLLANLNRKVSTIPGVISAATTDVLPLSMGNRSDAFTAEGRTYDPSAPSVDMYMATPGYFDTLGIARIAGRDFGNENPSAPQVAIVNEAFVKQVFPHEDPLGKRVTGAGATYRIVGIVRNINSRTLGEDTRPVLFRSLAQTIGADPSTMGYTVLVRTAGDPASISAAMRREIRSLDPSMAVFNAETMDEHFHNALFLPRLVSTLFGVFGAMGLLLATVGLYGVMSYSISRRTREIGIRMALGAQVRTVHRMVLRQGMILTLIAIAIGLAASWALAQFSASLLYGVQPHDGLTFTLVPIFLAGIALLACSIPARRAASVDPLVALRYE